MQLARARDQNLFAFNIILIGHTNIDRTNRRAGFVIVESRRTRCTERIDHKNRITLANCVIRASGSHAPQLMQSLVIIVAIAKTPNEISF